MATLVFDVNETLSDMSVLASEFQSNGAPPELASTWFAAVLRDAFALSLHGQAPSFLTLAHEVLVSLLSAQAGTRTDADAIADRVLERFSGLGVHADAPPGIRRLADAGHQLLTLSNGSVESTHGLLMRAGLRDAFSEVLSVEGTGVWKPHPDAYRRAADTLGLEPEFLTMVAVHPWDLDGAHRTGMRTILIDRTGQRTPASFEVRGKTGPPRSRRIGEERWLATAS